jgi:hypothetical protein
MADIQDDVAGPAAFTVLAIMFVEVRKGPSTDNLQNQRFERTQYDEQRI